MCKLMLTENHGNNYVLYKTLYNHYWSSYATSADAVDDSLERRETWNKKVDNHTKYQMAENMGCMYIEELVHLLLPVWRQHSLPLVVSCQSVDATLNQNQPELWILVLQDMTCIFNSWGGVILHVPYQELVSGVAVHKLLTIPFCVFPCASGWPQPFLSNGRDPQVGWVLNLFIMTRSNHCLPKICGGADLLPSESSKFCFPWWAWLAPHHGCPSESHLLWWDGHKHKSIEHTNILVWQSVEGVMSSLPIWEGVSPFLASL